MERGASRRTGRGLIGAVHGRVVEPPRARQAFAQTNDAAEGIDDAKAVARRPEQGAMNVSHAINLGALYNRIDRPADALDAVIDMDASNTSPFGMMQAAQVRACAYAALARQAELKTTRAWIGAGWAVSAGGRVRLTAEGWLRLDALTAASR